MLSSWAKKRRQSGFTLIEMLVTLTLFSLVLTSLVTGLHAGATTWERMQDRQHRAATVDWAYKAMALDIGHLASTIEGEPFLVESKGESGTETLSIATLSPRTQQRTGVGAVWSRVVYEVRKSDDGKSNSLVRVYRPFVSQAPLVGADSEEVLLEGVDEITFSYFDGRKLKPDWEEEGRFPVAIEVRIVLESGKVISQFLTSPLGMMGMQAT